MTDKETKIFPPTEDRNLSVSEIEEFLQPYNQQTMFFDCLNSWSETACSVISQHGFKDIVEYGSLYKLFWHPLAVDCDGIQELTDADRIQRAIREVYDSYLSKEVFRLANATIFLGHTLAAADSRKYDAMVNYGINAKQGRKAGGQKSTKSIAVHHVIEAMKESNPELKAKQAWHRLIELAENNYIVTVDEKKYELSIDMPIITDLEEVKVISKIDKTGMPDGRAISLKTIQNKFNKL